MQHGVQQWAGDGGGDVFEGEVGGGKGNTQAVAGQHHDDLFGVADGG